MIKVVSMINREAGHPASTASCRPEPPARRRCNLCLSTFRCHGRFERFCPRCREDNELLRFSEWLPEQEFGHPQPLSA